MVVAVLGSVVEVEMDVGSWRGEPKWLVES